MVVKKRQNAVQKSQGHYMAVKKRALSESSKRKALKEAINPEYDDGGYASFGIDISYEILDKNTQETIEQGEFYSSNEYMLARTESELDIEYKMELRKVIGNNATYQNVLLNYQRPDRMSSYFLVDVDPEDYDLYFAEVENNQEVSLTVRLTAFSHDEGMQIVGEDVTMDEIFMESQRKTNMRSKRALKESLITNGRKPISNLSINLFKEAQKKSRRKPIVEAGGDEIWDRVERAKEYLGGGDYLLDDFVKAMSNDAVEDILDYIERVNDIGYDEEQMESLVTEKMKKVIKESKQPRNKRALKESVAEQYKQPNGDALFYAELKYDINEGEKVGDLATVDFAAKNDTGLYRNLLQFVRNNLPPYSITLEQADELFYYGMTDVELTDVEDFDYVGFSNLEEGDKVRIYGELYVVDAETDETISISDGVGLNDDVFIESKQSRRKSPLREFKKPLKESLCMPISGMEYMVYKKGAAGEGSGKVIVIGIATVNGENVTINGTKYNKAQYDFVGTKGY